MKNKIYRLFIVFMIVALIPITVNADWLKGKIITLENDTINGEVEYRGLYDFEIGFFFKKNDEKKFYKPKILKGVEFYKGLDTLTFDSRKDITVNLFTDGAFVQRIYKGCVTLYFEISLESGMSIPAYHVLKNDTMHVITDLFYRKTCLTIFKNDSIVREKIKNRKYKFKETLQMIKDYCREK
jgi:hypothetical protein